MCAGDGRRWNNHLDCPKWLAPVHRGEPLLNRTVRLLFERTKRRDMAEPHPNVYVTAMTGAKQLGFAHPTSWAMLSLLLSPDPKHGTGTELDRFYNGLRVWDGADRIVYLYGDVFYTEDALDTILATQGDFRAFGLAGPSAITGCPHGEIFAISLSDKPMALAALDATRDAFKRGILSRAIGWEWYRMVEGLAEGIGPRFVTIDDWTADFDTPEDFKRWRERRAAAEGKGTIKWT